MNRYTRTRLIGGKYFGTCDIEYRIRQAVGRRRVKTTSRALVQGERLDTIAAQHYGSGTYWWIIAAASGIGWQAQVPAGTWITIPMSLDEIMGLII